MWAAKYCARLYNLDNEDLDMSRAGKYPVKLSDGVSAAIAGDVLTSCRWIQNMLVWLML